MRHVALVLLLSGCFGTVSPKGVTTSGATTGSTGGDTTGATGNSAFTEIVMFEDAADFTFDSTAVEFGDGARLLPHRFIHRATGTSTSIGSTYTGVSLQSDAIQQVALTDEQRRGEAETGIPAAWLTFEDTQPFADLYPLANGDNGVSSFCTGPTCPSVVSGALGKGLHYVSTTIENAIGFDNASALPQGNSSRVMCAWVTLPPDSDRHWALSYGEASGQKDMALGVEGTSLLGTTTADASQLITAPNVFSAESGGWQHLCFAWALTSHEFSLWANGALAMKFDVTSTAVSGDMGALTTATGRVGEMNNTTGTQHWIGDIDEVVIFFPSAETTDNIAADVAHMYRWTRPAALYGNDDAKLDVTFDAASGWPWSQVAIALEAPSLALPPVANEEATFGANAFPVNGNTWRTSISGAAPIADRSGSGHLATCTVGACPSVESDVQLMAFDGVDDVLTVDNPDAFASTRTLCAYASSRALDDSYAWIASLGKPTVGHAFAIGRAGRALVVSKWGGDINIPQFWDYGGDINGLHLVCATYDGSTVAVYGDGVLLHFETWAGGQSFEAIGNHAYIGQQVDGSQQWFGTIGFVGAWSRVLTAGEMQALVKRSAGALVMQLGSGPAASVPTLIGPSGPSTTYVPGLATVVGNSFVFDVPASERGRPLFRTALSPLSLNQITTPRVLSIEALPAKMPPLQIVSSANTVSYLTLTAVAVELGPDSVGEVKVRLLKNDVVALSGTVAEVNAGLSTVTGPGVLTVEVSLDPVDGTKQASVRKVTVTGTR